MKKHYFLFVALFSALFFPFLLAAQPVVTSIYPDNRFGNYSTNVQNTGTDVISDPSNPSNYLEAYVFDGTNPGFVINDGVAYLGSFYGLPSTATDPDVAINYDANSGGHFYIHVVFYDANMHYWWYVYDYPIGGPFSSTPIYTQDLTTLLASSGYSNVLATTNYTGPNIDVSESLYQGGIVLQDVANSNHLFIFPFYGSTLGSPNLVVNSATNAAIQGVNPDIAAVSDEYLITYTEYNNSNLAVDAVSVGSDFYQTNYHILSSIYNPSYSHPRIAASKIIDAGFYNHYSWTVVTDNNTTGGANFNQILSAAGDYLASTTYLVQWLNIFDCTNSSTWTGSPFASYDMTNNYNYYPAVAYDATQNIVQIGWTTEDDFGGNVPPPVSKHVGLPTVAGIMAHYNGYPYIQGSSSSGAPYCIVPYGNNTLMCPISAGSGTGVNNYDNQSSFSVAGRNLSGGYGHTPSVLCYFDDGTTGGLGCYDEVVVKNNYGSVNYREVKTNTELHEDEPLTVSVTPNPFTDKISIHSNSFRPLTAIFTDVAGRTLMNATNDAFTLSMQLNEASKQLAAGIYFIKIMDGSNTVLNQKVVKM